MRKTLLICLMLLPMTVLAQNWDQVTTSGKYYYGTGRGANEKEAMDQALAELTSMIATHVSSDFRELTTETDKNGTTDHQTQVLDCVRTYSQATLRNVEKWPEKMENGEYVVRCYIKRTELEKIYDERIAKAKDMVGIATECLQHRKIDMALQYYYWAYSLIRSLQRPNEVEDDNGRLLVDWLPLKINEILSGVSIAFEQREGDNVDLLFSYEGQPVSSIDFVYSDGRSECLGTAKDGRGMMEMAPGHATDSYHVSIEYEYRGQARGDAEMESVLGVTGRKAFARAEMVVNSKQAPDAQAPNKQVPDTTAPEVQARATGIHLQPTESQTTDNAADYAEVVMAVVKAIRERNSFEAQSHFTFEGRQIFRELIGYGTGRVVGNPNITIFKSANGKVVARGLQMSFSFGKGRAKKTFVEDVVFTLNQEKKIENMAFGLGQVAANDILCKHPSWNDDTKEMLMEFLESYKTAYCLKRFDYIRDIFADDAVIIIGNVAKPGAKPVAGERKVSIEGQEIITYNRYSKDQYLKNLKTCFDRNEFINIRFSNNDVQWLEKYDKEEVFAIQIGQEYNSTTYGDKGYLFLLVNMTNHDLPQIKVRTWQPNEVDMKKLYSAGDFYNE